MGTWIDFKQLRESLDVVRILQHYRVDFKRKGSQATAICPLPGHPKDGKRSPSFSVSIEKRIFQCFGCGAKGNILDFVAHMERLNPQIPQEFRRAAVLAQEQFSPSVPAKAALPVPSKALVSPEPWPTRSSTQSPAMDMRQVLINEPLDFELKNLDMNSPYLLNRGFTEETITHFGLGYCSKGLFAGRIVIPLHDIEGRLIGYAGRIVFDEAIDDQNPKYLYPAKRERNGQTLEFAKSMLVYNGHSISETPAHDLIVVQGFPAVWWLWQHGYRDAVALMGASCTFDQGQAILKLSSRSARIWCFTDAGNVGDKCAQSLFTEVGAHRFCKRIMPRRGQPTSCDAAELADLLAWKIER